MVCHNLMLLVLIVDMNALKGFLAVIYFRFLRGIYNIFSILNKTPVWKVQISIILERLETSVRMLQE